MSTHHHQVLVPSLYRACLARVRSVGRHGPWAPDAADIRMADTQHRLTPGARMKALAFAMISLLFLGCAANPEDVPLHPYYRNIREPSFERAVAGLQAHQPVAWMEGSLHELTVAPQKFRRFEDKSS